MTPTLPGSSTADSDAPASPIGASQAGEYAPIEHQPPDSAFTRCPFCECILPPGSVIGVGLPCVETFREAWEAKVTWGSHAQQHPCTCSIADGSSVCRVGAPLYANYMRLANICNGLLGAEHRATHSGSSEPPASASEVTQ